MGIQIFNEVKQKRTLVSVIVPNYNHATFLQKRLDSIFAQSYPHYEVILLDDASVDASLKVLRSYEDNEHVSCLLVNEFNSGSAIAQWKKGVEYAQGDLVWIAESDDFCEPNFLERLVSEYERYEADITYCDSLVVDDNSLPIDEYNYGSGFFSAQRWNAEFFNHGKDELRHYLAYRNTIPNASAVLFKRRSLVVAIAAGEGHFYTADWRVYVEILIFGTIRYVPDRLNFFREHRATSRDFRDRDYGRYFDEGVEIFNRLLEIDCIDILTHKKLIEMVAMHSKLSDIRRVVEGLAILLAEGLEVTVWGYSQLSRTLLALYFDLCSNKGKVAQVVDRRLKGASWSFYLGVPLRGPDEMDRSAASTVLIASQSAVGSIRADIVERLDASTQVVTFDDFL